MLGLFNDAFLILCSFQWVILKYELDSICKEAIVAHFKIPIQHLPWRIEEDNELSKSRYQVSYTEFELKISRKRSRSYNCWTAILGPI
jgi:hypothetical protein